MRILGVGVDIINADELVDYILSVVHFKKRAILAYVNAHAINLAVELEWFRGFMNSAQVVFSDGIGVQWAARFLTGQRLQLLTTPDWFYCLAVECAKRGISLYLLGAHVEAIEKAAATLKQQLPGLKIAGIHHGYFDKRIDSPQNQAVLEQINSACPNILLVGFGMPAQEKWILDNWNCLDVNVVVPVGAFFDHVAGQIVRPPHWLRNSGLEWLGRLIIEPRRLWRRYLVGIPVFVWRVVREKASKKTI